MLLFHQLQKEVVHDKRQGQIPLEVRQYRRLSSYLMSLHSDA
jgi:hypothetical protein